MKIRMVALDLDGTILNHEGKISPRTKQAIAKLQAGGVEVVLCTGRNLPLAVQYAMELGLTTSLITCNGAEIRKMDGKTVRLRPMDGEQLERVVTLLQKYDALFELYGDDFIYFENKDVHVRKHLDYIRVQRGIKLQEEELKVQLNQEFYRETGDFQRFLRQNRLIGKKFYVMENDERKLAELRAELGRIPGLSVSASHRTNIEISHCLATKGNALKHLAEMGGLDAAEVAAVGDGENDISMFRFSGMPIAMGNAAPKVKEAAAAVTETNFNDGLALALERWVL